jgi:hypothetical protein
MGASKWYIIGGLAALGLFLFIYLAGKSSGKKKIPKDQILPNSGSGVPKGWDPSALADEGNNVLHWYKAPGDKEDYFLKLLNLTDDQLTAVWNQFNHLYYTPSDGTLTEWINDSTGALLNSRKGEVMDNLKRLHLNEKE